jgi:hypothetical protein
MTKITANQLSLRIIQTESRRLNPKKMSQPGATQPCHARGSSIWNLETNFIILEIL